MARAVVDRAIDPVLVAFFLIGVGYLILKSLQIADDAGFDFRFVWVAGKLWSQGINPYGPEYGSLAEQLTASGYVPPHWFYPPNWVIPSVVLAQTDLNSSAVIFNILNILALMASSALLTAAFSGQPPTPRGTESLLSRVLFHLSRPRNVFFLHMGAMASLQATALVLSVGQNSILIYLGVSLLVYGLAKERQIVAVLGLVLLLLKPQMAATIVAVLLMDRARWGLVLKALAASVLISAPAFIIAPTAALDWWDILARYDGLNAANGPASMTGLRNLIWDVFSHDIGNMAGLALAVAATVALRIAAPRSGTGASEITGGLVVAVAGAIAFAPLHLYDWVLVGVILIPIAGGGAIERIVGALGALVAWRADDLAAVTGFYGSGIHVFEGSRIATLGGILLLIAAFRTVRRLRPIGEDGAVTQPEKVPTSP